MIRYDGCPPSQTSDQPHSDRRNRHGRSRRGRTGCQPCTAGRECYRDKLSRPGASRQAAAVAQRGRAATLSRGRPLASTCIQRSHDGWHVEGDRTRGPDIGNTASTRTSGQPRGYHRRILRDDQRARRRAQCVSQPDVVCRVQPHRRPRRGQSVADDICSERGRRCRRADVLWSKPARSFPADSASMSIKFSRGPNRRNCPCRCRITRDVAFGMSGPARPKTRRDAPRCRA